MTDTPAPATDAGPATQDEIEALERGLEGVTPGNWFASSDDDGKSWSVITLSMTTKNTICYIYGNRAQKTKPIDARHLARCSPGAIRRLLALLKAKEAELAEAKTRIGELEAIQRAFAGGLVDTPPMTGDQTNGR